MVSSSKHNMVTGAYVHVVAGAGGRAAREIEESDTVSAVHVVTGDHDISLKSASTTTQNYSTVVADEIHTGTGVLDTVTNVAFEP